MMQLKKGMMVLSQIERVAGNDRARTAQARVVLTTRVNQEQETRERRFKRGMMVGCAI